MRFYFVVFFVYFFAFAHGKAITTSRLVLNAKKEDATKKEVPVKLVRKICWSAPCTNKPFKYVTDILGKISDLFKKEEEKVDSKAKGKAKK